MSSDWNSTYEMQRSGGALLVPGSMGTAPYPLSLPGTCVYDILINTAEVSADGEELILYTNAVRKQGNLRIVLLYDGEYAADIPVAENQRIAISNPHGNFEIRLAAESAELEFE